MINNLTNYVMSHSHPMPLKTLRREAELPDGDGNDFRFVNQSRDACSLDRFRFDALSREAPIHQDAASAPFPQSGRRLDPFADVVLVCEAAWILVLGTPRQKKLSIEAPRHKWWSHPPA